MGRIFKRGHKPKVQGKIIGVRTSSQGPPSKSDIASYMIAQEIANMSNATAQTESPLRRATGWSNILMPGSSALDDNGSPSTTLPKPSEDWLKEYWMAVSSSQWSYIHIGEVFQAINRLGEVTMRALQFPDDTAPDNVKTWVKDVDLNVAAKLLVVSGFINGRAIADIGKDHFKVRDAPKFRTTHDPSSGAITGVDIVKKQDSWNTELEPLKGNIENISLFVPYPRFSDDPHGIPATWPALLYINMLRGIIARANHDFKKNMEPLLWIEAPNSTTESERTEVRRQFRNPSDWSVAVLPMGFKIHLIGKGDGQYDYDALVELVIARIFTALGVPRIALGVPEGTNRSTANVDRDLLFDKAIPFAEILAEFLNKEMVRLFSTTEDVFSARMISPDAQRRLADAEQKVSLGIAKLIEFYMPLLQVDKELAGILRAKIVNDIETSETP